jgi:hypothetical protein
MDCEGMQPRLWMGTSEWIQKKPKFWIPKLLPEEAACSAECANGLFFIALNNLIWAVALQ